MLTQLLSDEQLLLQTHCQSLHRTTAAVGDGTALVGANVSVGGKTGAARALVAAPAVLRAGQVTVLGLVTPADALAVADVAKLVGCAGAVTLEADVHVVLEIILGDIWVAEVKELDQTI
jgi:hypothetical protein